MFHAKHSDLTLEKVQGKQRKEVKKMKMNAEIYENKISELRKNLRILSMQAQEENRPVCSDFWQVQKDLQKVWKNYQAWCIRHGKPFPQHLYYAS